MTTLTGKAFDAPQQLDIETLLQHLESREGGLTTDEAEQRLAQHGPNVLRVKQDTPQFIRFLRQFKNFFAVLLLAGGCLALVAETLDPGAGNLYIACALFGVTVLNAIFTFVQEFQSERIMASFRSMLPSSITAVRDGQPIEVEAADLVPGDVVMLAEGDKVPADARLLEQNELAVDLSSLTGESEPVRLDAKLAADNLIESRNMVFSGTLVQSGDGRALICHTGMDTQIGNIVTLTKETEEVETPIRRELKHFIRIISAIAITLGLVFFLVSVAIGNPAIGSLIFAIGIIVANVPEGLLPTVTLALGMASKRMARKKALIKHLESVETLGSTTVICTDKTGTLTQNRLSVSTLILDGREYRGDDPATTDDPAFTHAWRVMNLCNNARLTEDGFSGDATEGALLTHAALLRSADELAGFNRVAQQPFDSSTRKMITVNVTRGEPSQFGAYMKGAPEVVLEMCDQVLRAGQPEDLDEDARVEILSRYQALAARAERGLALAYKTLSQNEIPSDGFIFIGIVGMLDPPRPEVSQAIDRCRSAGIRVAMVTGDHGLTALSIARQIGMVQGQGTIVQGEDLNALDEQGRAELLAAPELIFARVSPIQKLEIVRAFQAQGETVTMTGDGVNDAPALKNADMGVAMGLKGTDVAREASDMVLMDDNFATIVAAVEEGRTIYENIKKFIAYILTSNIPEILPFIAYVLLDIPLPLTVVLILAIDLGTDIVPALGLGAEAAETDVMHRPPRARSERLLTVNLLGMSYGIVGMLQAAAGFFSYFVILLDGGWQWGQALASDDPLYRTAVTGFFASIIICQVADVMICRTRRQSLFSVGFLANKLVLLGIAVELGLLGLISYVPTFNTFFGTAPLSAYELCLSVPFAVLILFGDELRRVLVRRGNGFVLRYLTW